MRAAEELGMGQEAHIGKKKLAAMGLSPLDAPAAPPVARAAVAPQPEPPTPAPPPVPPKPESDDEFEEIINIPAVGGKRPQPPRAPPQPPQMGELLSFSSAQRLLPFSQGRSAVTSVTPRSIETRRKAHMVSSLGLTVTHSG